MNHVSVTCYDQQRQLPLIKADDPELKGVYSQVLQDVIKRVDKAYDAFFRRIKAGQKAGFPRFHSNRRYDSLTYPQGGFDIEGNVLHLSKVGDVKVKLHRPVEGNVKTLTIKRECGRWYACFSVEMDTPEPMPHTGEITGIDVGLTSFAVMADGEHIENPRYYRTAQAQLRRTQRRVSRRKKGSNRRRKAVGLLKRAHQHVKNQRADFHHKESRKLVDRFSLIAVEDLNIKGLAGGMLAKSVNDAGWGSFLDKLTYKAEYAGRVLVRVNPNGTSQRCPCGASVPKTLAVRWHTCTACGLSVNRDHASALEILRLGLSLQASTQSGATCVA